MLFLNSIIVFVCVLNMLPTSETIRFQIQPVQRKACCTSGKRTGFIKESKLPLIIELVRLSHVNPAGTTSNLDPTSMKKLEFGQPMQNQPKDEDTKKLDGQLAYICSQMGCSDALGSGPVCACNYKTGNVVSFKNNCDLQKHNCRFNTDFKVIFQDVCPWEFESRGGGSGERSDDEYKAAKFYN